MYFPPEKDMWLGILGWGVLLVSLIWTITEGIDWYELGIFIILWAAIFVWIWFGTGYTITDNSLEVKCGPFEKQIPFSKIYRIKRAKVRWFCAALSFSDLLEIKYRYGVVSISPLDSHKLINELKQRCPELDNLT
jgi:hypothetical protein